MGVFEYLGVILSVIMGLGVTHVLAGISKTIHHRKTVKPYWVQSLWAFNVLTYIMAIWWGMFWWSGQQEWSYFQFLLLILYAILLFLSASLIFPWDFSDDFDFEDHFYQTRPWFFTVLAMAWCVDIPETMAKSDSDLRALPEAIRLVCREFVMLCKKLNLLSEKLVAIDGSRFKYIKQDDEYRCPAGERLTQRTTSTEKGKQIQRYWSSACGSWAMKSQCTNGNERRVSRWVHEDVLERAAKRLRRRPTVMLARRSLVEHPFGTLKAWTSSNHFLTKRLPGVSTETSLQIPTYNMKRAINLVGTRKIMEAIGP